MTRFVYKAKQGPSKVVEGVIEAENFDKAVAKIIQLGFTPVDVKGDGGADKVIARKINVPILRLPKRVSPQELSIFTRQLSDLIDAGVPLLRVLNVVRNQIKNPYFKEVVNQMYSFVEDGGTLSAALAEHPHNFSKIYINMVKAGEISGKLGIVLNRLADFS